MGGCCSSSSIDTTALDDIPTLPCAVRPSERSCELSLRPLLTLYRAGLPPPQIRSRVRSTLLQWDTIPHAYRWWAYQHLSGGVELEAAYPGLYRALLLLGPGATDLTLRHDAHRTLPGMPFFGSITRPGPGQSQLYRILTAYSHLDPHVGYTQGMNFLAATLLLIGINEQATFFALSSLMLRAGLRGLYAPGLPSVIAAHGVIDRMLHRRWPLLAARLTDAGVLPGLYSTPWLMSSFVSSPLPPSTVLGVLDRLLIEAELAPAPSFVARTYARIVNTKTGSSVVSEPLAADTTIDENEAAAALPNVFVRAALALVIVHSDEIMQCHDTDDIFAIIKDEYAPVAVKNDASAVATANSTDEVPPLGLVFSSPPCTPGVASGVSVLSGVVGRASSPVVSAVGGHASSSSRVGDQNKAPLSVSNVSASSPTVNDSLPMTDAAVFKRTTPRLVPHAEHLTAFAAQPAAAAVAASVSLQTAAAAASPSLISQETAAAAPAPVSPRAAAAVVVVVASASPRTVATSVSPRSPVIPTVAVPVVFPEGGDVTARSIEFHGDSSGSGGGSPNESYASPVSAAPRSGFTSVRHTTAANVNINNNSPSSVVNNCNAAHAIDDCNERSSSRGDGRGGGGTRRNSTLASTAPLSGGRRTSPSGSAFASTTSTAPVSGGRRTSVSGSNSSRVSTTTTARSVLTSLAAPVARHLRGLTTGRRGSNLSDQLDEEFANSSSTGAANDGDNSTSSSNSGARTPWVAPRPPSAPMLDTGGAQFDADDNDIVGDATGIISSARDPQLDASSGTDSDNDDNSKAGRAAARRLRSTSTVPLFSLVPEGLLSDFGAANIQFSSSDERRLDLRAAIELDIAKHAADVHEMLREQTPSTSAAMPCDSATPRSGRSGVARTSDAAGAAVVACSISRLTSTAAGVSPACPDSRRVAGVSPSTTTVDVSPSTPRRDPSPSLFIRRVITGVTHGTNSPAVTAEGVLFEFTPSTAAPYTGVALTASELTADSQSTGSGVPAELAATASGREKVSTPHKLSQLQLGGACGEHVFVPVPICESPRQEVRVAQRRSHGSSGPSAGLQQYSSTAEPTGSSGTTSAVDSTVQRPSCTTPPLIPALSTNTGGTTPTPMPTPGLHIRIRGRSSVVAPAPIRSVPNTTTTREAPHDDRAGGSSSRSGGGEGGSGRAGGHRKSAPARFRFMSWSPVLWSHGETQAPVNELNNNGGADSLPSATAAAAAAAAASAPSTSSSEIHGYHPPRKRAVFEASMGYRTTPTAAAAAAAAAASRPLIQPTEASTATATPTISPASFARSEQASHGRNQPSARESSQPTPEPERVVGSDVGVALPSHPGDARAAVIRTPGVTPAAVPFSTTAANDVPAALATTASSANATNVVTVVESGRTTVRVVVVSSLELQQSVLPENSNDGTSHTPCAFTATVSSSPSSAANTIAIPVPSPSAAAGVRTVPPLLLPSNAIAAGLIKGLSGADTSPCHGASSDIVKDAQDDVSKSTASAAPGAGVSTATGATAPNEECIVGVLERRADRVAAFVCDGKPCSQSSLPYEFMKLLMSRTLYLSERDLSDR